ELQSFRSKLNSVRLGRCSYVPLEHAVFRQTSLAADAGDASGSPPWQGVVRSTSATELFGELIEPPPAPPLPGRGVRRGFQTDALRGAVYIGDYVRFMLFLATKTNSGELR